MQHLKEPSEFDEWLLVLRLLQGMIVKYHSVLPAVEKAISAMSDQIKHVVKKKQEISRPNQDAFDLDSYVMTLLECVYCLCSEKKVVSFMITTYLKVALFPVIDV